MPFPETQEEYFAMWSHPSPAPKTLVASAFCHISPWYSTPSTICLLPASLLLTQANFKSSQSAYCFPSESQVLQIPAWEVFPSQLCLLRCWLSGLHLEGSLFLKPPMVRKPTQSGHTFSVLGLRWLDLDSHSHHVSTWEMISGGSAHVEPLNTLLPWDGIAGAPHAGSSLGLSPSVGVLPLLFP